MRRLSCFRRILILSSGGDYFHQPHSCDSSPVLCSVAFRSGFICSLVLDLDPDRRFLSVTSRWSGAGT